MNPNDLSPSDEGDKGHKREEVKRDSRDDYTGCSGRAQTEVVRHRGQHGRGVPLLYAMPKASDAGYRRADKIEPPISRLRICTYRGQWQRRLHDALEEVGGGLDVKRA
jgi:hypothetical protein